MGTFHCDEPTSLVSLLIDFSPKFSYIDYITSWISKLRSHLYFRKLVIIRAIPSTNKKRKFLTYFDKFYQHFRFFGKIVQFLARKQRANNILHANWSKLVRIDNKE